MLTRSEQDQLNALTIDAYSRNRYTSWNACIAALANKNFSFGEAQAILMSKHMRWAADASDKPFGRANSSDLLRYIDEPRYAKFFTKKALADLIAG